MPRSALLASIGALWIAGCATLNESECRSVDWFELGSRDGASGHSRGRLENHSEACSEFGLKADESAWREGYETGLEGYCTIDNGYSVGRHGGHYGRVCPAELEGEFVAAYELGRETHDVQREIEEISRYIESAESRLAGKKDLSDDARSDLRRQLYELYRQLSWLRRSRDRLEDEWRRR